MRKYIIAVVSLVTIAGVGIAVAQQSPSFYIAVSGVSGNSYQVWQVWNLSLSSALPNTAFSICAIDNRGVQSCTPEGTTNAGGGWSAFGTFSSGSVGNWTEWILFPSQSLLSNKVSFTVAGSGAGSAQLSISVPGASGNAYHLDDTWSLQLSSSFANAPFSMCAINNHGVQSCTPWGSTNPYGGWTGTGTFGSSTVGSWTEWISFTGS